MTLANAVRGEVALALGADTFCLRPSFAALVAAEAELGPLFALVERAAGGGLMLAEMAALFWFCLDAPPVSLTRAALGERLVAAGLANVTPALRALLAQVLAGR
jgi:uncharacterized MnhB-related membrane protein